MIQRFTSHLSYLLGDCHYPLILPTDESSSTLFTIEDSAFVLLKEAFSRYRDFEIASHENGLCEFTEYSDEKKATDLIKVINIRCRG